MSKFILFLYYEQLQTKFIKAQGKT